MLRSLYAFRNRAIKHTFLFIRKFKPVRERVTLGEWNDHVEREHVARYEFATRFCQDKTVADIACGSGYGTEILRRVAREVHAFDRENLCGNNLVDLETEKWPGHYDVVVSFETIEHLANPEFFLANARRTAGFLIVSTPVGELPGYNPHHKQIWTSQEFQSVMQRHFVCKFYFQYDTKIQSEAIGPFKFVIAAGTPLPLPSGTIDGGAA